MTKNNVNRVKKRTYIQIPNGQESCNLSCKGDVNVFNPERKFKGDEIGTMVFATYNPYSERFSPFAYGQRV